MTPTGLSDCYHSLVRSIPVVVCVVVCVARSLPPSAGVSDYYSDHSLPLVSASRHAHDHSHVSLIASSGHRLPSGSSDDVTSPRPEKWPVGDAEERSARSMAHVGVETISLRRRRLSGTHHRRRLCLRARRCPLCGLQWTSNLLQAASIQTCSIHSATASKSVGQLVNRRR